MLGRQQKNLTIRLLKITEDPIYHIVVTRKRSKNTSRIDRLGVLSPRFPITILKIDIKKLHKYLVEKEIKISKSWVPNCKEIMIKKKYK
jgi:ribosomal protein S16